MAHTPLWLGGGGVTAGFIVTTDRHYRRELFHPINTAQFRGFFFLKNKDFCPWLLNEMFNQQELKAAPTSNFV